MRALTLERLAPSEARKARAQHVCVAAKGSQTLSNTRTEQRCSTSEALSAQLRGLSGHLSSPQSHLGLSLGC